MKSFWYRVHDLFGELDSSADNVPASRVLQELRKQQDEYTKSVEFSKAMIREKGNGLWNLDVFLSDYALYAVAQGVETGAKQFKRARGSFDARRSKALAAFKKHVEDRVFASYTGGLKYEEQVLREIGHGVVSLRRLQ